MKVRESRQVEADDELAQKVHEDKNNQQLKQECHEREAKDRLREIEIDKVNRELEKTSAFTFDFHSNLLVQNHQVGDQLTRTSSSSTS